MLQYQGENSKSDVPVHLISRKENMYENITLMLKFLFKYCEEQEHDIQETSLVLINLLKGDNKEGNIQIDVDGAWLKSFKIRRFIQECSKHKLNFLVYYGNALTKSYFFYEIVYKEGSSRSVTTIKLEETAMVPKDQYLRVIINSTESILQSILDQLRNFLKETGPQYPNVTFQFDESIYKTNKNSDDVCIQMISEGFGDVLQYSTNLEFRRKIFETLNVTSKEWAMKVIQSKLGNIIGNCDKMEE